MGGAEREENERRKENEEREDYSLIPPARRK